MSSGLVMYPAGHARNQSADLNDLLDFKFHRLAMLGVNNADALKTRFSKLRDASTNDIASLYDFEILAAAATP